MLRNTLRILLLAWTALAAAGCPSERPAAPVAVLDLNAATEKQLESLPGIGPERARSIMASRNARGGHFSSLDELVEIKGIGKQTVEKIRPYVVLGPGK
jgi:competence protein ComEA